MTYRIEFSEDMFFYKLYYPDGSIATGRHTNSKAGVLEHIAESLVWGKAGKLHPNEYKVSYTYYLDGLWIWWKRLERGLKSPITLYQRDINKIARYVRLKEVINGETS